MSRISDYEDDSEYAYLSQGRWERNLRVAVSGRRGQKALREIEAALLALPEKRLIEDDLCRMVEQASDDGDALPDRVDVCVLGAYALHRGFKPDDIAWKGLDDATETAEWAQDNLGITFTLAWRLVELNDEAFGFATPKDRYLRMLAWVREQLA